MRRISSGALVALLVELVLAASALLVVVNATGYMLGFGQRIDAHIVSQHTTYDVSVDAGGEPDFHEVPFADGYYLDGRGRRHEVTFIREDLLPGAVVHTRRHLVPWGYEFKDRGQATWLLGFALVMLAVLAVGERARRK